MAAQSPAAAMNGQSSVAGATFGDPATIMALQGGRVTAAVEEQQSLLSQLQILLVCARRALWTAQRGVLVGAHQALLYSGMPALLARWVSCWCW